MITKAAVLPPYWRDHPSGGRRGLHYIARELRDHCGVEAYSVGVPYQHEDVGDTVVAPDDFAPDEETALILPEGAYYKQAGVYYMTIIEDMPHGPVIIYAQNAGFADPAKPWETHYWGLGENHNTVLRERYQVDVPIEEMFLPVDTEFWWRKLGPDKWLKTEVSDDPLSTMGAATSLYNEDDPNRPDDARHVAASVRAERIPGSILYCPRRNSAVLEHVQDRCGMNHPVFRVNGVSPEQLRTLMAMADIFVLASEWEGQSCLLNEAMAMECACVTWPSCGLLDIIDNEENGLLVPQNDVPAITDAVQYLQEHPEEARRLGTNARAWVKEHLSWAKFRENLAAAWAKVEAWTAPSAGDPPASS